ncbi:uncharacterized protein [Lepisosteus oculatus]|uniref:uncharacterized protein n=1 Tax=Lepisosteus oculatus TaxID=7918 RepID=UPI00371C08C1
MTLKRMDMVKFTSFCPRSTQRLILTSPSRSSDTKMRLQHWLSRSTEQIPLDKPCLEYIQWLKAGEDPNWQEQGWRDTAYHSRAQNITVMIASLYPLSLPKPSRMGPNTYTHFLSQKGHTSSWSRKKASVQSNLARREQDRISFLSQIRTPTLDSHGNILPPENFKRQTGYRLTPAVKKDRTVPPVPDLPPPSADGFRPRLGKLSFQKNCPVFEKLMKKD